LLVDARETIVGIGLRGIEPLRLLESRNRVCVLVLTSIDATEVEIGQPNGGSKRHKKVDTRPTRSTAVVL
jgi:hypothetical protein